MSKDRIEMLEYVMAVLDEARGFAAMSPGGRDNISEAYDMLPELMELTYRAGFSDDENHNSENDTYNRGSEWQPIENAPRDGTPILAADKGRYAYVAEWIPANRVWIGADGMYWEPTHWMPLPGPPK